MTSQESTFFFSNGQSQASIPDEEEKLDMEIVYSSLMNSTRTRDGMHIQAEAKTFPDRGRGHFPGPILQGENRNASQSDKVMETPWTQREGIRRRTLGLTLLMAWVVVADRFLLRASSVPSSWIEGIFC